MKWRIVEATNNFNWGKFLVCVFEEEDCNLPSAMEGHYPWMPLLGSIGWNRTDIIVFDLQTCEGAAFSPSGGSPSADLEKHRVWVCPLYEPFLHWLYKFIGGRGNPRWIDSLPALVSLPAAPSALYGHRRAGAETSSPPLPPPREQRP